MPKYTPEYCESLLAANPQGCSAFYDRIMRGKVIADVADHTTFVLSALEDGPKSGIQVAVWCRANGDPGMEGELAKRICDRLVRESKAFKDGQVYSVAAEAPKELAPADSTLDWATFKLPMPAVISTLGYTPDLPAPTTSQEAAPIRRANASTKTDVRVVARRMQPRREASIWPDILERCEKLEIGESTNVDVPARKFRNVFAQDIRNRLNASTTKQWLWNATQAEGNFVIVTKRELNPKYPGTEDFQQPSAALLQQPTPLRGAFPINGSEASKTITLHSGGTLTLCGSLDLFALTSSDRQFVFDLIDKLDGYEKAQRFQEQI